MSMPHSLTAVTPFGSFRVRGDRKLPTHYFEEMDVPLGSQPKKELTSASLFFTLLMAYHHEWSQSYIKGLTFEEHHVNNEWFNNMLAMLKDDGELYVPMLEKSFNKSGEEVSS